MSLSKGGASCLYPRLGGNRSEIARTDTSRGTSDLGVSLTPNASTIDKGDSITLTAVATNNGPNDATGPDLVIAESLPQPMQHGLAAAWQSRRSGALTASS